MGGTFMSLSKWKKPLLLTVSLSMVLSAGMGLGYASRHFSADGRFTDFTEDLFRRELSGSTLNLHYTLAEPEKYQLSEEPVTLGTVSSENIRKACEAYEEYEETLKNFPYEKLSRENQITLDTLLLYCHTQQSLKDTWLLEECLSPSLGIQAQLPVLLAEYPFYKKRDITNYLKLLTCIRPYFESILLFEQEKSQQGTFMSDASLNRVLDQCRAFIADPSSNYLTEIFHEKLESFSGLTAQEAALCLNQHQKILEESVIPAYRRLMEGLLELQGTGRNDNGLAYLDGGRDYYEYLLKSQVGSYVTVPEMEKRMYAQLTADCREISEIFKRNPEILKNKDQISISGLEEPAKILEQLQDYMKEDFPALPKVDYQVKYVHPSMEDFLSPAFYLTPPIDTGTPNTIYINKGSNADDLELFSTLAHEGFPGHLYQTQFFSRTDPNPALQVVGSSGYIEGWATYIESYAYRYAPVDQELSRLVWLNRSVNLCLYSLVDTGIHYRGWNLAAVTKYLGVFGIQNPDVIREMFQYIVETPANYLKYYWGYLNFLDLLEKEKQSLGEDFDLKDFHREILEIGPVPFPVLEKYIE